MATGSRTKSRDRKGENGAQGRSGSDAAHLEGAILRRRPRQERSRATVEAILEAAAELFADQGYARTTTNKIALRAGVSIGSLYQYFPDKDSVLARLLEEHHRDVHRVLVSSLGELADRRTGLEEGLRNLMQGLVSLHNERPELTRALRAEVLGQSRIGVHKNGEGMVFTNRVAEVLAGRPDVRAGDHLAMAAVVGQATGTLTRWLVHEAPPELDGASLLEESVQLLVRYLAGP